MSKEDYINVIIKNLPNANETMLKMIFRMLLKA